MDRSFMVLAPGFEEVEALAVVDILRRAGLDCTTAGLKGLEVTGSHGITVKADGLLEELDPEGYQCLIIPGGKGVAELLESPRVLELVRDFHAQGKTLAAICAGPKVLLKAGVLTGRRAACYPGVEGEMDGVAISREPVVIDGKIVTSRGMGTAIDLGLALVAYFKNAQAASDLAKSIVYNR